MALSITINKVAVADSFAAGTKVADIVVSGGISPYAYELATGGDYFQISGTEVQVINEMNISNIQSFSVTATDSTSGTALTITSKETYPSLAAEIQSRLNSANKIYKITQDIDLGHGVLTIPANCTLDFQGGSFSNGTVLFNYTKFLGTPKVLCSIDGTLNGAIDVTWFGADNTGNSNIAPILQQLINTFNVKDPSEAGQFNVDSCIYFPPGKYLVSSIVHVQRFFSLRGDNYLNTIIHVDIDSLATEYSELSDILTHNDNVIFVGDNYVSDYNRCYTEIVMSGITIEGNSTKKTSFFKNSSNGWINKADIHDCCFNNLDWVLDFQTGYWVRIYNNFFDNCKHCLVLREGNSDSIINNTFRDTVYSSIVITSGASGVNISGNDFSEAGFACISIFYLTTSSIVGN